MRTSGITWRGPLKWDDRLPESLQIFTPIAKKKDQRNPNGITMEPGQPTGSIRDPIPQEVPNGQSTARLISQNLFAPEER